MNISSVSSSSSVPYTLSTSSAGDPSRVAALEKQIATLTKQISTENTSKDNAKTKAEKVAMYRVQLQMIQAEVQQLQQAQQSPAKVSAAVSDAKSNVPPASDTTSKRATAPIDDATGANIDAEA